MANLQRRLNIKRAIEELPNDMNEQNIKPDEVSGYEQYLPKIDQFYIPEWFTMKFLVNNLVSFTPLLSYGSTVWSIRRVQTAMGFSIDICATMIIASILRISYYMITPYEIALLRQSMVMVFIQLILLHTSLKYRPEDYIYDNLEEVERFLELVHDVWVEYFPSNPFNRSNHRELVRSLSWKNFSMFSYKIFLVCVYKFLKFFDPNYKRSWQFWQWRDTSQFWKFIFKFILFQFTITFIISKVFSWDRIAEPLGSFIGSLGLLVEATLPLPQIAILSKLRSVQGFKLILLVSWLSGDVLKITYLILGASNISVIFLFFGLFQMLLDFYIAYQYIYYKYYYKGKTYFDDHPIIIQNENITETANFTSKRLKENTVHTDIDDFELEEFI